ncbi:helix-turn-helix domain-containing protein [Blastococcus tunisiensis]|uniref:Helix-turn-helix domain-containing protein n=1 Tax=Blastococcus tunisiensis TaxID=1798228 RepID=A0A1I2I8F2_9ACTN|nr:helix-turn-helix transcriptional regulator [Blastococcus sp. DSM 46838]SFF37933.1 Helix-turn-helix domain-containing protein [Blastococcus sp. DSM 46838]
MGRPQRPIPDDDRSPEAEFGRALRRLRADAGDPTYAQLQRRTGYSDTTLSAAASGRGRPSREVVQALVVALGGDAAEWDERWRALPAPDGGRAAVPPSADTADGAGAADPGEAVPVDAPAPRWRRPAAMAGVAGLAAVAVAVTGFQLAGAEDPGRAPASSPSGPVIVTVQNEVTAGPAAMREDSPAYLSSRPENSCRARGCLAPGDAAFDTGDTLEVVCQVTGERTTNGNDGDPADDANPELFTSTRWYGSRLPDGSLGYLAETWISPADRGGLGLPRCG